MNVNSKAFIGSARLWLCPLIMFVLIGCRESRPPVPDLAALSIHCREGEFLNTTNRHKIVDVVKQQQFVAALRSLDWSAAQSLENVKVVLPDIDLLLTDATGRTRVYQTYWRHDSLLDQSKTKMLETDVSDLRKLVAAETYGARLRIGLREEATGKLSQSYVPDPTDRTQILNAVERMELDGNGLPLATAGDMRALEVVLSFIDRQGVDRLILLYWGAADNGVIVESDRVYDVSAGLRALRALLANAVGQSR